MLLTKGCPVHLPVCHNCPKALPRFPSNRLRAVTFRKVTLVGRQSTLICRAEDRGSAVTDIRKIDTEKGGLTHTLRETVFTPESLVPVALGVGGAFLAGYGQDGAVLGTLLLDYACKQVLRLHACLICCTAKSQRSVVCRCCCWSSFAGRTAVVLAADSAFHLSQAHFASTCWH